MLDENFQPDISSASFQDQIVHVFFTFWPAAGGKFCLFTPFPCDFPYENHHLVVKSARNLSRNQGFDGAFGAPKFPSKPRNFLPNRAAARQEKKTINTNNSFNHQQSKNRRPDYT